jgi:hypothetical protein
MQTNEENLPAKKDEMQVALPKNDALALYATASTLKLTPEESTAMMAEFDESVIEVRPDGHIYLPQSYYRNRLNSTVGIGQWGLIVKGTTQEVNGSKIKMLLNGVLVIRNCFVAEAVGEAELHADNAQQSLATVWESAKSDCITRCCKDLSMARQIYEPTYRNSWLAKFAVQVWIQGKDKPQWRKKDSPKLYKEAGIVGDGQHVVPNNAAGVPGSNQSGSLPWLNKTTRAGGATKEWTDAVEGLLAGTITIETLEESFKISKGSKIELQQILKNKPATPAAASEKEKVVTGSVWAQLEKCKTKEDVDALAMNYKSEITSWNEWRHAFTETKKKLPLKKDLQHA